MNTRARRLRWRDLFLNALDFLPTHSLQGLLIKSVVLDPSGEDLLHLAVADKHVLLHVETENEIQVYELSLSVIQRVDFVSLDVALYLFVPALEIASPVTVKEVHHLVRLSLLVSLFDVGVALRALQIALPVLGDELVGVEEEFLVVNVCARNFYVFQAVVINPFY